MLVIKREEIIHRPVEEVFKFVATDYFENRAKWAPESPIEKTSEGPMSVGTTGRSVAPDINGNEVETIFIVTEYDPPRKVAMRSTSTFTSEARKVTHSDKDLTTPSTETESSITLQPVSRGTNATFRCTWRYVGVSRIYGPLLWYWKAPIRRSYLDNVDRLLDTIEGPALERRFRRAFRTISVGWVAYTLTFVLVLWIYSARDQLELSAEWESALPTMLSALIVLAIAWVIIREILRGILRQS